MSALTRKSFQGEALGIRLSHYPTNTGQNAMPKEFVAYYRVSSARQGQSGLGLDAQREAVRRYVQEVGGSLLAEHTEVESGKNPNRPIIAAAIAECRKQRAVLLIAKLDRLSRNVAFISRLMDGAVDFVAVDFPAANRLLLHILAAVAENEREQISQRTKAALAAAKARGVRLGTYGSTLAAANRDRADSFAETMRGPLGDSISKGNLTLQTHADHLNGAGHRTPEGSAFSPTSVRRVLLRLGDISPGHDHGGKSAGEPQNLAEI